MAFDKFYGIGIIIVLGCIYIMVLKVGLSVWAIWYESRSRNLLQTRRKPPVR